MKKFLIWFFWLSSTMIIGCKKSTKGVVIIYFPSATLKISYPIYYDRSLTETGSWHINVGCLLVDFEYWTFSKRRF